MAEIPNWQLHIWGHPNMKGASKHTGRCPNIWGTFKHTGVHPNIWGHSNLQGVSKHCSRLKSVATSASHMDNQTYKVYPNIWGHSNIQEASKNMGASKCMGAYGDSLSVTKHAFFVLCIYGGHPNINQIYRGCPNIWGCQTKGTIQTYGHPNIQGVSKHTGTSNHTGGHPNIWGVSKHIGVSKHTGGTQTYRGVETYGCIQTYRGHPNIWVMLTHIGGIQT